MREPDGAIESERARARGTEAMVRVGQVDGTIWLNI